MHYLFMYTVSNSVVVVVVVIIIIIMIMIISQLYAGYLQLDAPKKMFLGYTVLQLFCSDSLWYM
jgi:hypothetical protein